MAFQGGKLTVTRKVKFKIFPADCVELSVDLREYLLNTAFSIFYLLLSHSRDYSFRVVSIFIEM